MTAFFNSIAENFEKLTRVLGWRSAWDVFRDLLDILLVAYIIYALIMLARQTRAAQLMRGIVVLLVAWFLAGLIDLKTIKFLLDNVLQFGLIAAVVVFQPEIRRALEQMGRSKLSSLAIFAGKLTDDDITRWNDAIVTICDSAERMSKDRTGALIVIERKTSLGEIVRTGTLIDAGVTGEILETIFYEGTPLHDGAVIVKDGRIEAAGCILPVSQNTEISKDMGTRHRAALGMSENSDALVIVVSEETGIISVARDGLIVRRLDKTTLYRLLQNEIIPPQEEKSDSPKAVLGRLFKK